jgi:hypothetical protein
MILPPDKLQPVAKIEAYQMAPDLFKEQWGAMLAPFSPPLPREGEVIVASFFGDVFVEDRDGAVWWVNGMEERVDRIAINRENALQRIGNESFLMLKTKLMEQLIKGDKLLPAGMLYGLKTPRSQGGKYEPDNIGTAPIAEAFAYMGSLFQAANVPPPKPPEAAGKQTDNSPFWAKKK